MISKFFFFIERSSLTYNYIFNELDYIDNLISIFLGVDLYLDFNFHC